MEIEYGPDDITERLGALNRFSYASSFDVGTSWKPTAPPGLRRHLVGRPSCWRRRLRARNILFMSFPGTFLLKPHAFVHLLICRSLDVQEGNELTIPVRRQGKSIGLTRHRDHSSRPGLPPLRRAIYPGPRRARVWCFCALPRLYSEIVYRLDALGVLRDRPFSCRREVAVLLVVVACQPISGENT